MDEHLQRLARELRNEKCPREVLDRVAQRLARDTAPRRARHYFAWALASVCILGVAAAWQWQERQAVQVRTAELAAQKRSDRMLVVQQTHGALAYIGQALLEAAAHSQNVILEEAAPPVRNGLQSVKSKVTHPIKS